MCPDQRREEVSPLPTIKESCYFRMVEQKVLFGPNGPPHCSVWVNWFAWSWLKAERTVKAARN